MPPGGAGGVRGGPAAAGVSAGGTGPRLSRERERDINLCMYRSYYPNMCVCIYICIERER